MFFDRIVDDIFADSNTDGAKRNIKRLVYDIVDLPLFRRKFAINGYRACDIRNIPVMPLPLQ